jgi:hypothetical protein
MRVLRFFISLRFIQNDMNQDFFSGLEPSPDCSAPPVLPVIFGWYLNGFLNFDTQIFDNLPDYIQVFFQNNQGYATTSAGHPGSRGYRIFNTSPLQLLTQTQTFMVVREKDVLIIIIFSQ